MVWDFELTPQPTVISVGIATISSKEVGKQSSELDK